MLRNLLIIILSLATMLVVGSGIVLWTGLQELTASLEVSQTSPHHTVSILSDPTDWVGLAQTALAAIAILAAFFTTKVWEILDAKKRRRLEARLAAENKLKRLINARSVVQTAARQVRFAMLVAFRQPIPGYLGTASGFVSRWDAWIKFRVEELVAELRTVDARLIGEAELGTARLTVIARLRWLFEQGGASLVAKEGELDLDLFRRAWSDVREALLVFVRAENHAREAVAALGGEPEQGPPIATNEFAGPPEPSDSL